jgi:hypothetical protein
MVAALHSLPTVIGSKWTVCQTQFSARHLQKKIGAHTNFSNDQTLQGPLISVTTHMMAANHLPPYEANEAVGANKINKTIWD